MQLYNKQMQQNNISLNFFNNKRSKGYYIKKTKSNIMSDNLDHSKPKNLFRENFNKTCYQINLLTKTQKNQSQQNQRENSNKPDSIIKSDRFQRLYAFKKNNCNLFKFDVQNKNQMTNKIIKRKRGVSLPKEIPPIIYKSNIVAIQKRQQIKDDKKETHNTEISGEQQQQQVYVKRELEKIENSRIRGKHKLPVVNTSGNKNLLNKIFDRGEYEDRYQQINQFLLKKENIYRSKGINLQVQCNWRI